MATRKRRYQISFDERMLKRIEKFQTDNDYTTKSGAIQELIRIGLETIRWRERDEQ